MIYAILLNTIFIPQIISQIKDFFNLLTLWICKIIAELFDNIIVKVICDYPQDIVNKNGNGTVSHLVEH